MILITAHAMQRARKRLGLKRRAVRRAVETAWSKGGYYAPWIDRRDADPRAITKVWRGAMFVFVGGEDGVRLVTVMAAKSHDENTVGNRDHKVYHAFRRARLVAGKRRKMLSRRERSPTP